MGQQLVHKENIMLNLSATDKESSIVTNVRCVISKWVREVNV